MILHGDCRDVIATLPDCSVDSVVTDPPYELGFMGKAWDASGVAYDVGLWRQVLRVLKPGGHLLAFGGTRTYHRLAVAIEDAGFEVRDSIHWLYGSGFPKSLDVSKAIDKAAGAEREVLGVQERQGRSAGILGTPVAIVRDITAPATDDAREWEGWGTALKPAHEPIVVARKPLAGTVASTVLAYGTGAINVDGCRVEPSGPKINYVRGSGALGGTQDGSDRPWKNDPAAVAARHERADAAIDKANTYGRWPANLVLTHAAKCADACVAGCPVAALDKQSGMSESPAKVTRGELRSGNSGLGTLRRQEDVPCHDDAGGASRFFSVTEWDEVADVPFRYVAKPSRRERDAGLDLLPRAAVHRYGAGIGEGVDPDAPAMDRNYHPTVKPLALMRWLVRLVTPKGGTVLEPFAGSGTTLMAATMEGFDFVGIEMTAEYLPIIEGRVAWAKANRDRPTPRRTPVAAIEGQLDLFGGDAA